MSAGLSALRDNDGGARIDRDSHVIEILALADQRNVGFVDLSCERHRIAEREHKRRRFPRQGLRHDLRRALGGPSNESDANTLLGCSIELLGKPRGVAVSATDQPERTRSTDRSRQSAAASKRHRGRDDRMGDAKRLGEPSRNHTATISTAICADKRETRGEPICHAADSLRLVRGRPICRRSCRDECVTLGPPYSDRASLTSDGRLRVPSPFGVPRRRTAQR